MSSGKTFFGHPRGLATLFFTEMFERFSYYGMRALLILFMTKSLAEGGLSFDPSKSGAIYGLYVMGVYIFALPGGWLADRIFGLKKSVWYGGITIAIGHFTMAIPGVLNMMGYASEDLGQLETAPFFLGLILIALGTGLLKPNVSSMVGSLYSDNESTKRDAGFSIFYSGINLGGLLGPLIAGTIGESVNWHLGFGVAGLFMVLGLIQYKLTSKYISDIGNAPDLSTPEAKSDYEKNKNGLKIALFAFALIVLLCFLGIIPINAEVLASFSGILILIVSIGFLSYVYFLGGLDAAEKKKLLVIAVVFFFSALFWSGFEQAGSSLNLFADRFTDRVIFGWQIPASIFQSINSFFIIIFAPIFGALWIWLGRKNLEPSSPLKFAFGLILLGVGFLVMVFAAKIAATGELASYRWLILTYMFHTFGELSLSPVGLSLTTKLAPKKFYSQMMGIWFMSVALGNLIAGVIGGKISGDGEEALSQMPDQYMLIVSISIGSGLILILLSKPIRKLMGNVK